MADKIPYIDVGLLRFLEQSYPDRCPDLDTTDRELWFHCGAVSVVKHLRRLHEDQHEKELGEMSDVHG